MAGHPNSIALLNLDLPWGIDENGNIYLSWLIIECRSLQH